MDALLLALQRARAPRRSGLLLARVGGVATAALLAVSSMRAMAVTEPNTERPSPACDHGELAALERGLQEAEMLGRQGRHERALGIADDLLVRARVCGPREHAHIELVRGRELAAMSEAEPSAEALERAYFLAVADGDPVSATEAMSTALEYSPALGREATQRWVRHAEALSDGDAAAEIRLATARGTLALLGGDAPAARRELEVAQALAREGLTAMRDLAMLERAIAQTRWRLGDSEGAIALFERAQQRYAKELGETHPIVADTLVDLAFTLSVQHTEQSRAAFEQAIDLYAASVGHDAPRAAAAHHGLARLTVEAGEYAAAVAMFVRARDALLGGGAAYARQAAVVTQDLGVTELARGRPEHALPYHDEAMEVLAREEPTRHGYALLMRTTSRVHAGDAVGAVTDARRARELMRGRVDAEGVAAANVAGRLCEALLEAHLIGEALERCAEHLRIVEGLHEQLFLDRALMLRSHAMLLTGDRSGARAHVVRLLGEREPGRKQLFELRPACRLAALWRQAGDDALADRILDRARRMYVPDGHDPALRETVDRLLRSAAAGAA
jgi:tetratricopeptide (TPR) repeat protein